MTLFFRRSEIWKGFYKPVPKVEGHPGRFLKSYFMVEQKEWEMPFKFRKSWKKLSMFKRFFCLADNCSPVRYSNKHKRHLVLHHYLRTVMFPSFKKRPWKNYLKQKFKKHSFYLVQDFLWFLASRADHLLFKLGLRNKIAEVTYLVKRGYISVNGVEATIGSRVPLHSVIHFSYLTHLLDSYRWEQWPDALEEFKVPKIEYKLRSLFTRLSYNREKINRILSRHEDFIDDMYTCIETRTDILSKLCKVKKNWFSNRDRIKKSWASYRSSLFLFCNTPYKKVKNPENSKSSPWMGSISLLRYNLNLRIKLKQLSLLYYFSIAATQVNYWKKLQPEGFEKFFVFSVRRTRYKLYDTDYSVFKLFFGNEVSDIFFSELINFTGEIKSNIALFQKKFFSVQNRSKVLRIKSFKQKLYYKKKKQVIALRNKGKVTRKFCLKKNSTKGNIPYLEFIKTLKQEICVHNKHMHKLKKNKQTSQNQALKLSNKLSLKVQNKQQYYKKGNLCKKLCRSKPGDGFFLVSKKDHSWLDRYLSSRITKLYKQSTSTLEVTKNKVEFGLSLNKYSNFIYKEDIDYILNTEQKKNYILNVEMYKKSNKLLFYSKKGFFFLRNRLAWLKTPIISYRGLKVKQTTKKSFTSLNRFVIFSASVQSFYFFKNYYSIVNNNFRNVHWERTWFSAKNLSAYLVSRIYNSRTRI